MKGNSKCWEGDNTRNNKGGSRLGCPNKNRKQRRKSSNASAGKKIPKGSAEEMEEAYGHASTYQATIIDYADKEDFPQEVIDYQRRIFHFAKYGPRKGFFKLYPNSKLVSADVLYILSAKIPKKVIAKRFNISEWTIAGISSGRDNDWLDEYHLVRRIRKALVGKYKKNWKKAHITTITDSSTGELIALLQSIRKAKEYRRGYLKYKRKISSEDFDRMEKDGELDILFPIEERTVTK